MAELQPAQNQPQSDEDIVAGAENYYAWYRAYQDAGFTAEESFQLLCRPLVVLNNNMESSPDMNQVMSKMAMLFDRQLAEDDEP